MERSESIGELAKALSQAQSELEAAEKNAKNPYFNSNYSNLNAVWSVIRDPLAKNGLSVAQLPDTDNDGNVLLETILMHSSGQWIKSKLKMIPSDKKPQTVGICLSYARRYALAAMVGVYQEDDDGNIASGLNKMPPKQNLAQPQAQKQKPVPKPKSPEELARDAKKKLYRDSLAIHGWENDQVVEYITKTMDGITKVGDLDDAQFKDLMEFVRKYPYQHAIDSLSINSDFENFQ